MNKKELLNLVCVRQAEALRFYEEFMNEFYTYPADLEYLMNRIRSLYDVLLACKLSIKTSMTSFSLRQIVRVHLYLFQLLVHDINDAYTYSLVSKNGQVR